METMLQHQEETKAKKFYQSKKFQIGVLVFFIVGLAFLLRTYHITQTPPGVYPDEAVNGMDALTANATGQYQWFYPSNNGREGLFMNLIAFFFKFFGVSVLTLKLPSIIFGTLTVFGMYLLGKELFKKESAGLISAFLTAVSFWAINFSRISFRAIQLPFVLVFSFYFLFKAVRTKKWSDFIIGGLIFGLGLHTYIAFRIAPAILVALLISFILSRENFLKVYWKYILVYAFAVTVAAAPMLFTFYQHPEYISSRSSEISVFNPAVNQGHLLSTILVTFGKSLGEYNFWGDQNWRQNYPPYPVLDYLTGIAFMFGFIYSLIQLVRLLRQRFVDKIRNTDLEVYALLLVWFFIMMVPEFLTNEGLPHALRSIGTMPAALLFAGLTFSYFYEHVTEHGLFYQKTVRVLIIVILLTIGAFNITKYFYLWANKLDTARSFDKNVMEISDYIKTLPAAEEKYIVAESMQRIPIKVFNQNLPNTHYLYPGEVTSTEPRDKNNFVFVFTDRLDDQLKDLTQRFPNAKFSEVRDSVGMSYYTLINSNN